MSATEGVFTKDVTDILDLYFERDGDAPDWAVIRTRLYQMTDSQYAIIINLLKAMWAVYEDESVYKTLVYQLNEQRDL